MTKSRFQQHLETVSTLLLIVAAGFFIWSQVESRWFGPNQRARVEDLEGETIAASKIRNVEGTGPIALIEFTDYQCPFCGRHAQTTSSTIRDELTKSGRIRHIVFNFPLEGAHAQARAAAEAAECAGQQGRFWEMHERLFQDQEKLSDELLHTLGVDIGLDVTTFNDCRSGAGKTLVSDDLAEGRRLGVNSTPTFFVGTVSTDGSIKLTKRLNGALPYEEFKRALSEAVSKKQALR